MISMGLFYSGIIKRRESGSPERQGWCQQRRRLPMRGGLTTSSTSPAGGKSPRSSTWTMTSWRTDPVCPVTSPLPPRALPDPTPCPALPRLSSPLRPTPPPPLPPDCSDPRLGNRYYHYVSCDSWNIPSITIEPRL